MADELTLAAAGDLLANARNLLCAEQRALALLSDGLDDSIVRAAASIAACAGRILISGIGKSGIVARKIAASFCSLDVPAQFIHAGDALHGDLGAIRREDMLVAISVSGTTRELVAVVQHARQIGAGTIGITGNSRAPLARGCDRLLLIPSCDEGAGLSAAPFASTMTSIATGDMLCALVVALRGNRREQMYALHPAGEIGRQLLPVRQLMHGGDRIPLLHADADGGQIIAEISIKGFGIAGVIDETGALIGTISDGDIRRHAQVFGNCVAGDVMVTHPVTLPPDADLGTALELIRTHRVSALFVVEPESCRVLGVVHIQDLLRVGIF